MRRASWETILKRTFESKVAIFSPADTGHFNHLARRTNTVPYIHVGLG